MAENDDKERRDDRGRERRAPRDGARSGSGGRSAGAGRSEGTGRSAGAGRSGSAGRSGASRSGGSRDGARSTGRGPARSTPRDGEKREWKPREGGDRRPPRDGEKREWKPREGGRDGGRNFTSRDGKPGEKREWKPREGGDRRPPRDGERREWKPREGGDRRPPRDGERREWKPKEELTEQERIFRELKAVRPRHEDPVIDENIDFKELDAPVRNELKALTKENADFVTNHLIMASRLLETDPELAHQHALSAARKGGRIASVRESLGITAYLVGDFQLALRELRTFRRISGSNDEIALMVDCERGIGRPDKALELGRSVDKSTLPDVVQAALAVAMSGARLDQGQPELALAELEIPQLDPNTAYSYSPDLFFAYAEVLDELGRAAEAKTWRKRAEVALAALEEDEIKMGSVEKQTFVTEYDEVEAEPVDLPANVPAAINEVEAEVAELLGEANEQKADESE